jgi:hypothetical protein
VQEKASREAVRLQLQNRCAAESVKIHPENAVMGEKYMVQIGLSMWPQMREHGPDFVFFFCNGIGTYRARAWATAALESRAPGTARTGQARTSPVEPPAQAPWGRKAATPMARALRGQKARSTGQRWVEGPAPRDDGGTSLQQM